MSLDIPYATHHHTLNSARDVRRMKHWQTVAYWLSRGLGYFLRQSSRLELDISMLSRDMGYVIASTHRSSLDPFIISGQFMRREWNAITPMRFFVHPGLWHNPLRRWIMIALGCFTTKEFKDYPFGLEFAYDCLDRGQSLFIFPEGKRTPTRLEARRGVGELAQNPKVMVIPVHIEWRRGVLGTRTFRLAIGQPFNGAGLSAEAIMDRVYALELEG